MNIDAAIAWVEDHIDFGGWAARSGRTGDVKLSLDRMRRFVGTLGNPQDRLSVVHVSGTNGKGSTSKMTTRLLMAEGLTVGTYSSPHLARYNERFRIDDTDIDDDELAAVLTSVATAEHETGDRLMPFEVLTAAAFTWFASRAVDVAVIEVGVLGRYDATNVADGRVAVITNIGFDHTSGDGDWRMRIAAEKAGIVKPGAHVVLGPMDDRLVEPFAAEMPGVVWRFGDGVLVESNEPVPSGRRIAVRTPWQHAEVDVPLHGQHQGVNAALAITAAGAFLGRAVRPAALAAGLAAVRMPGRLETFRVRASGAAPAPAPADPTDAVASDQAVPNHPCQRLPGDVGDDDAGDAVISDQAVPNHPCQRQPDDGAPSNAVTSNQPVPNIPCQRRDEAADAADVGEGGPTVILDGAHNPDAIATLAAALTEMPSAGRRTLIIGLLDGRDPSIMLTAIDARRFDAIVACTPPTARARPGTEVAAVARQLGCDATSIDDVGDALATTIDTAQSSDQIVVTGSIYLVAAARTWLLANAVPLA